MTGISRSIRIISGRSLTAVLGGEHLELAEQLEPHLEHEDIVIVVFDVKHFCHDAASIPLLTG